MYFSQDKKVPKNIGCTRFARKRTSMNGFSGSMVRLFVVTDCFSNSDAMVKFFVDGYFLIH